MHGSRLLIHLADASHPRVEAQLEAVSRIIGEIGLGDIQALLVFNKADLARPAVLAELAERHPGALFISAATGEGIPEMLDVLAGLRAGLGAAAGVPGC
jgi:GTP-binding protein HflX